MSMPTNMFQNRTKRLTSYTQEVPTNTPKFIPKRSLTFCEIKQKDKDLRETDVTLSEECKVKNMHNININDFQLIRFLGNGRFGTVYLARYHNT